MTQDILQLRNDTLSVDVSRFGGSLLSGSYRGIPFLKPTPTPGIASHRFGAEASFPLLPYGNRIEGNSFDFGGRRFSLSRNSSDPFCLHGDGWLAEWDVETQNNREIVLCYVHKPDQSSPYAYEAIQRITLDNDCLILALTVTNTSADALPFGIGFHPYFPRTPKTKLTAGARRFWTERAGYLPDVAVTPPKNLDFAAGLPLSPRWINNAYDGWNAQAVIEWPEHALGLAFSAGKPFDCFMIYSPGAEAGFFCFEPMTHLPNAHNMPDGGGLVTLAQQQSLSGSVSLRPFVLTT